MLFSWTVGGVVRFYGVVGCCWADIFVCFEFGFLWDLAEVGWLVGHWMYGSVVWYCTGFSVGFESIM